MPIYEYACESCGHQFEKLVRIGAEAPPCPECEGARVRKRVSASGFILKGSGWYKDHYGLKGGKAGAESTTSASASSGPSESASKPAEPAVSKPAETKSSGDTKGSGGKTSSGGSAAA